MVNVDIFMIIYINRKLNINSLRRFSWHGGTQFQYVQRFFLLGPTYTTLTGWADNLYLLSYTVGNNIFGNIRFSRNIGWKLSMHRTSKEKVASIMHVKIKSFILIKGSYATNSALHSFLS